VLRSISLCGDVDAIGIRMPLLICSNWVCCLRSAVASCHW
jgi:hypothetical protein